MDKKALSERDICTKFITPALKKAGWDVMKQVHEEVSFTKGRVIVKGKTVKRGDSKRADYLLYYKPELCIAVVEAKDNNKPLGTGMPQARRYAEMLDVPYAFSSNGDAFIFHDRTGSAEGTEREITLAEFPTPEELWAGYCKWKCIDSGKAQSIVTQDYYTDASGKTPRRADFFGTTYLIPTLRCD